MDSKRRSIAKAVTWRALGTLVTIVVTVLITHSLVVATSIGLLDTIVKLVLYYIHERIWSNVP